MSGRIEDYAIIGNCETAALVGLDGSIDWLCMPRFDSPAFFSSLLGDAAHGRWLIGPTDPVYQTKRRYRGPTLILETEFETERGAVRVTDCLWRRDGASDLVRIVTGLRGSVEMRGEIIVRFDYGSVVPWVSRQPDGRLQFTAGPDRLLLDSSVPLENRDMRTSGSVVVNEGDEFSFVLTGSVSYREAPPRVDPRDVLKRAEAYWRDWSQRIETSGEWSPHVLRSLLTLKALTHWETGGIVAAATTSLPEKLGGPRNWDYRYCWLRDATFTLYAMMGCGALDEAKAWRAWLVRAAAGNPADVQIMYGLAGERRLAEYEAPWLPGYQGASPVRIGNAASGQVQLDVYGEVLDAFYVARRAGLDADEASWGLEVALAEHLAKIWREPDNGIWEVRGGRRHFTHSKVMAWVAFDRVIRSCEGFGLVGPVAEWRAIRAEIHALVCEQGFDRRHNSFTQSFGAGAVDASLLLMPMVGFLPPEDPRIRGTLAAIEQRLLRGGYLLRYDTGDKTDGLPPGEGAFLAVNFWLVDNYVLQGRMDEARALFERLLTLRNDVGLFAEEYDPVDKRQLGNFPQALTHLALVNSARNLAGARGPAQDRAG